MRCLLYIKPYTYMRVEPVCVCVNESILIVGRFNDSCKQIEAQIQSYNCLFFAYTHTHTKAHAYKHTYILYLYL